MSKHIFLALLSVIFLATACSDKQSSNGYIVHGIINDASLNGSTIYIKDYDLQKNIDSTMITDGKFSFTGQTDTMRFCQIESDGKFASFILDNGTIKIDFDKPNSPEGTHINKIFSQYINTVDSMSTVLTEKKSKIEEKTENDKVRAELIEEYYEDWKLTFTSIIKDTYESNSNNLVGVLAFQDLDGLLPPNEIEKLSEKGGDFFLSRKITKRILDRIRAYKTTAEGMHFTDFTIEDDNGNKVSLSEYVGKGDYVLVDFWASWCGPCRDEVPNIKEIYNKYKNKNFKVVGVALWDKPDATRKAIEEDKSEWPQIINAQEIPSKLYGIEGIPHIILFGPDGKVIARGLRGDEMKARISGIFH